MKNRIKTLNDSVVKVNDKRYEPEQVRFLSHISHGIRTPLNAIMGFSKLLGLRNAIGEKQKEYVQGILNGSNMLLQFVENIMDLSQFETNNYAIDVVKCDINKIIWEYSEDFYSHKEENSDTNVNIMLVWESKNRDFDFETDPLLLKKALQKLVNHVSSKYTMNEFELGYRVLENGFISIFVRPVIDKLEPKDFIKENDLFLINERDSFECFDFKVLNGSVSMLGGKLLSNSDKQEYSIDIPMKLKCCNNLKKS